MRKSIVPQPWIWGIRRYYRDYTVEEYGIYLSQKYGVHVEAEQEVVRMRKFLMDVGGMFNPAKLYFPIIQYLKGDRLV